MKNQKRHIIKSRNRGSILAITFFLCLLMAVAALWTARTLFDHQRTNLRRRDIARAYYAAEGGITQVLHWGNYPDDYDNLGTGGLFYRDLNTGDFPNLTLSLASTAEYPLSQDKYGIFKSKYNYDVSRVKQITLIAPKSAEDPIPCIFKILAAGTTPSGSERSILAYIQANPLGNFAIKIPAGLISMGTAAMVGNAKINWGESWSKLNFNMINLSQADYLNKTNPGYDPWAKYRTESQILFPSTWKSGLGKDLYQETTRTNPGATPASGQYENAFEQFIPPGALQWPDLLSQYDEFKNLALSHGRYYSTDAAGNIYKDGVEDPAHKVDFITEFEKADRASAPYDLVFIDTIDSKPPAPDGSNLATITSSGQNTGLKGVFWIGANFTQTGTGTPPILIGAEKPDLTKVNLTGIYLDGVLYSAGIVNLGGNAGVYGAVVVQRGFSSNGTPNIYYNHKLKGGLEVPKGNVGSVFKIALQKNI